MIIYHPSPFWKKSKATLLWYFEIAMEIALLVRQFTCAMWFLSRARCSKLPQGIHHIVPNYHINGDTSNEFHSTYIIYIWHLYIDIIHPIYWQFPVTLLLQVTKKPCWYVSTAYPIIIHYPHQILIHNGKIPLLSHYIALLENGGGIISSFLMVNSHSYRLFNGKIKKTSYITTTKLSGLIRRLQDDIEIGLYIYIYIWKYIYICIHTYIKTKNIIK